MTLPSKYFALRKKKSKTTGKGRKNLNLQGLPDWLIVLLLAACSFASLQLISILKDLGPDFIQVFHDTGYIDKYAVAGAILMILMSIKAWFLTMVASHCQSILKKRWFEPDF